MPDKRKVVEWVSDGWTLTLEIDDEVIDQAWAGSLVVGLGGAVEKLEERLDRLYG